ncbi:hypothetical protein [Lactiplantibacillus plantarum]|uniref:hypothetical protein n=1 Tax=Lactiplantibacillus plantarum TaxID=1590 RepID=UPI00399F35EA
MTAEKKEMQSVTIRIPKTLYAEYKKSAVNTRENLLLMTCEITWLKLSKSKRKDRNKHKKRAHPSKARSLIACSDTVILTLWLKIRQGTSLFCYIRKAFLLIGNSA